MLVLVIILWSVVDQQCGSLPAPAPAPAPVTSYTTIRCPVSLPAQPPCLCVGNLCLPSAKVETCCKHELLQLHHYHLPSSCCQLHAACSQLPAACSCSCSSCLLPAPFSYSQCSVLRFIIGFEYNGIVMKCAANDGDGDGDSEV